MTSKPAAHDLRWVRAPQQDRSKKTLTRLLDAAEGIIRSRGASALTVPEVARAARSSVGSFYARFADKDALLSTLHERACEQTILTVEEALGPARWAGVDTESLVRFFVAFAVRVFAERRPMMLAFTSELSQDAAFAARRARTAKATADALTRLFEPRTAEIGHPRPELAVTMGLRLVTSVLEQRNLLEAGGAPELAVSDDVLIEELTRAALGYLDVRPRRERED